MNSQKIKWNNYSKLEEIVSNFINIKKLELKFYKDVFMRLIMCHHLLKTFINVTYILWLSDTFMNYRKNHVIIETFL